ncbi:hypothetical protein HAZT_HAZT001623 [Hyalella azteca]|uniref:cellulase n=1 Tax=Hyalella azteca TaxID=294128 RepID=A0A6A0GXI5_HYAAZ|nr:hypothetical protein HAZT_HAZT001623 [Hyalella azteca]
MCESATIVEAWPGGYKGTVSFAAPSAYSSVILDLYFLHPVNSLQITTGGQVTSESDTHFVYTVGDSGSAGSTVSYDFQVAYSEQQPLLGAMVFNGDDVCGAGGGLTTAPPLPNPCAATGTTPYDYPQVGQPYDYPQVGQPYDYPQVGQPYDYPQVDQPYDYPQVGQPYDYPQVGQPYDYPQVLCMSILFYEAQRSGRLPADQRITWRWDSALGDGGDVGVDLTGGYYDAGDHVKFGLPLAYTGTVLAWGAIAYEAGMRSAGEYDNARAAVRWVAEYLLKAHSAPGELYGQVMTH